MIPDVEFGFQVQLRIWAQTHIWS